MAEERLSPEEERRILELLEKSALTAYPNPDRIGCPGRDFLRRLVFDRKSIPISHPGLDHLTQCSPCFAEFVEFRNQARRQRRLRRGMAVAAAVAVVAGAAWYALAHRPTPTPASPPVVAKNRVEGIEDFRIDLQNRAVPRGDATPSQQPLRIPRQQLRLSIDLPLASPPGVYEAQILSTPDTPLVKASGTATLEGGVTNLRITADLRSIPPGRYFLGFRRPPWDWTYIPIALE